MTNPKHTDTSRSGDLDHWECFCDASYYDMWCVREAGERRFGHGFHLVNGDEAHGLCDLLSKQADRLEALEAEVERLRNDSWFEQFEEQEALRDDAEQRLSLVEAKNERLCGVLEAVWKEATTMRNASKLIGPYPTQPEKNRIWARSMYHAGKKLHALIKPVRAALGEK